MHKECGYPACAGGRKPLSPSGFSTNLSENTKSIKSKNNLLPEIPFQKLCNGPVLRKQDPIFGSLQHDLSRVIQCKSLSKPRSIFTDRVPACFRVRAEPSPGDQRCEQPCRSRRFRRGASCLITSTTGSATPSGIPRLSSCSALLGKLAATFTARLSL